MMMMDVDDKKGKKKMFSEEEKIDTVTTTTTTTESEVMKMDVDHDVDDDEKGKKKMSLEEEEAEKLRIESLVANCSYYAMAQNPYTLRLGLGIDNKENKIIQKNSSVSAVDHHVGSSSSSDCRDKNQVQPTRKVVFAEDDVEKHHHHNHSKLSENKNGFRFRIPKRKPDENPNPNAEESKCVVCGKIFNSKKSLYGHMRSHPKDQTLSVTEMRSSHHHYSSSSPSTSIISADSMNKSSSLNLVISTTEVKRVGLELNLPRWLKKVKRGRRALTKEEIARKKLKREGAYTVNKQLTPLLHDKDLQRDGDHQDLVITGKQLEKLETGRDDPAVITTTVETQGIDEVEAANHMATSEVVINSKQDGLDDERVVNNISAQSDQFKDDGIVMENENFRSEKPWNTNMLPHEFTQQNRVKVEEGINAMEIKQKKTLASSMDGTYRCSECNKCFSSHQALGGHKSSHSTKKTKDVLASTSGAALEHDNRCGLVLNSTHQCKICFKSFPSGQALGGHQRSHYVQPTVPGGKEFTFDHKSAPVVKEATFELKPAAVIQELNIDIRSMVPAAVVQELNIDIRPVVERDFDLNELPVQEREEVDNACTALSISTPQPIQAA